MSTEVYLASRNDRLALIDLVSRGASGAAGTGSSTIYPQHHIPVTVQLHTSAAQGDILGVSNHTITDPTYDYENGNPNPRRLLQIYYDDPMFITEDISTSDHAQKRVILIEGGNAGDPVQGIVLGLVSTRMLIPEGSGSEEIYTSASLIDGEQKYLQAESTGDITVWHHKLGEAEQIVPCWVLLGAGGAGSSEFTIGSVTDVGGTETVAEGPIVVLFQPYAITEASLTDYIPGQAITLSQDGPAQKAVHPRANTILEVGTFYSFFKSNGIWYLDNQSSFFDYQGLSSL